MAIALLFLTFAVTGLFVSVALYKKKVDMIVSWRATWKIKGINTSAGQELRDNSVNFFGWDAAFCQSRT